MFNVQMVFKKEIHIRKSLKKSLKKSLSLPILFLIFNSSAKALDKIPLHLDLELTGAEYQSLFEQHSFDIFTGPSPQKHIFDDIFNTGKRNLDWLQVINKNRSTPLSLSTPETQAGYPIESPRIYNPQIIRNKYNELQKNIPVELKQIIFGNGELPLQLPVPDDIYIYWGLKVDRAYQIAARWRMMEPYLDYLKSHSHDDIRGYYFLTTSPGFPEKLKTWNDLNSEEQTNAKRWLVQVCRNDLQNTERCQTQTERAIKNNTAYNFFNDHKASSQKIMNKMMNISSDGKFAKANWSSKDQLNIPFVDPLSETMRSFLTTNLETEWKFLPFNLHIDFIPPKNYGVEVIWEPGITPHVPRLGDNTIYMDANAPISEYDVQWTIRHEFGHVLGFPDCYLEFYDFEVEAIVSYQIDTSDLMCSRRGHLKNRHVNELKKVYQ